MGDSSLTPASVRFSRFSLIASTRLERVSVEAKIEAFKLPTLSMFWMDAFLYNS